MCIRDSLGSKRNDYYDTEAVVPQRVIDEIPPVALCYWDYYLSLIHI